MRWLFREVADDGPHAILFPKLDRFGVPTKSSITSEAAVKWLRKRLHEVGVPTPERYGRHSARRGGLSDAIADGVPLLFAETQGHWKAGALVAAQEYDHQAWWRRVRFF